MAVPRLVRKKFSRIRATPFFHQPFTVFTSLRKPTYADFMALRDDVQTVKGWWRNGVARILLNFFLTSLGTAIGVWTGGLRMLGKLVG